MLIIQVSLIYINRCHLVLVRDSENLKTKVLDLTPPCFIPLMEEFNLNFMGRNNVTHPVNKFVIMVT